MERYLQVHLFELYLTEHFQCLQRMFKLYNTKEKLSQLIERPDIDLVCAHELYKLKEHVLNNDGLNYKNFHPEFYQGIKLPEKPLSPL